MLCYPPGRACPNFGPFDPSDCKEAAVSLAFANFDGSADDASRDRQTEFLRAGPKHSQFSDKLLWRYHRCTFDIFCSASRRMSPISTLHLQDDYNDTSLNDLQRVLQK